MRVLFMPGLDGTGRLFASLLHALPRSIAPEIVVYPDRAAGYEELAASVPEIEEAHAIVAESFSGPLAILLARRRNVRALVLVATFARSPRFAVGLGAAIGPALFHRAPPVSLLRAAMLAGAPEREVTALREAVSSVAPATLASRLRAIAGVDVRSSLAELAMPVLVIAARRDRLVPARATRELLACRSARLETIDGPHLILQAQPKACARAIADHVG